MHDDAAARLTRMLPIHLLVIIRHPCRVALLSPRRKATSASLARSCINRHVPYRAVSCRGTSFAAAERNASPFTFSCPSSIYHLRIAREGRGSMSGAVHIDYGYEGAAWLAPEVCGRRQSLRADSSETHRKRKRRRVLSRTDDERIGRSLHSTSFPATATDSSPSAHSATDASESNASESEAGSSASRVVPEAHPTRSTFRSARQHHPPQIHHTASGASFARLRARTQTLCLFPSVPCLSPPPCPISHSPYDPALSLVPADLITRADTAPDSYTQTRGAMVCLVKAPSTLREQRRAGAAKGTEEDWLICSVGAGGRDLCE